MAIHKSRFSGDQIDDVIGLFDNKGLNNVVGIIQKNENGTFSIADLSWVADKSETVNSITYDSINKKIIQSIDGVNSDVVSVATLMDDFGVGEANGIVPLNSSSKIDSIFLPSYVDDVLEFDGLSNFPETGEAGKIYVDTVTNKTYRWSGSIYVEISPSPVIPTNISAFVNDSGYITGYTETDPVFSVSPAAGITNTDINNWNGKSSFSGNYNDLTNKPTIPTISLNGSSTTAASFYAPTSAGTSGYVLVSSGSSAPTWASIPAGATVTLNGVVSATPSFYAPTTAGTSGQVLTSNGSGAPTWAAAPSGGGGDIFVAEYDSQTEIGTPFDDIKTAYEAGKYVVLKIIIETIPGSESEERSVEIIMPLIQLIDERTSEHPGALASFGASLHESLISVMCVLLPDSEDSSQLTEEWRFGNTILQPLLESGTNIKTVTGTTIIGSGDLLPSAVGYTTTVPTAANTTGLKFVLCDSEPSTKYGGWVYLIKES